MRVRDLDAGTDLADIVPDVSGSVVWTSDASAFYYVRLDRNHRPSRVFRHRLGTPVEDDVLIYEEAAPGYFVSVAPTQSRRFAEISIHDHETSECLAGRSRRPARNAAAGRGARAVRSSMRSSITPTCSDRTCCSCAPTRTAPRTSRSCGRRAIRRVGSTGAISCRIAAGIYLLSFVVLADWLIRLEREDGLPRIVVRHLGSGEEHAIAFAEEAYSLGMDGGYEFATNLLRFTYSSMTTPAEVWDYDLAARERTLRKRQEIPSGHDPSALRDAPPVRTGAPTARPSRSRCCTARTWSLDGTAPCLLYGYGAYGLAIPAAFSTNRLSLVDRGFVFAIAHVRGGTEKGWRWYREGKLASKTNTFTDFIAAAEHLCAQELDARRHASSRRADRRAAC